MSRGILSRRGQLTGSVAPSAICRLRLQFRRSLRRQHTVPRVSRYVAIHAMSSSAAEPLAPVDNSQSFTRTDAFPLTRSSRCLQLPFIQLEPGSWHRTAATTRLRCSRSRLRGGYLAPTSNRSKASLAPGHWLSTAPARSVTSEAKTVCRSSFWT